MCPRASLSAVKPAPQRDAQVGLGNQHAAAEMGHVLRLFCQPNLLRTQAREVELAAARAFPQGERMDIIEHLNRLSSGIYILFCPRSAQGPAPPRSRFSPCW